MRRSCAQRGGMAVLYMGTSLSFSHSRASQCKMVAHKLAAFAQESVQVLISNLGSFAQVFDRFYRVRALIVHTIHRPYGNYYYVYK